ncbi:pirin family protein [Flavobacterium amniphilum]|uniref:pirin family protein n=1 Tax=Flavobacterium amniphilum TaxID=1834035 RepID=UPI00202AB54B|nr:pirin family protein [Flavobacterium amniphilum]MCL9806975.1 pirin family protein [Flavobacterium amniphilum]
MSKIVNIEPLSFPWKTNDPFIFCAYHRDVYPKGNANMGLDSEQFKDRNIGHDFVMKDGFRMYHGTSIPGFPYHPHRGFETISINKEGVIDHSDSLGAAGRFMAGDVQWMTAGSGIQHSEMFPLINQDKVNPMEMFQIWLNLPKASKMVEPHFKMLWKENIPTIEHKDVNGNKTIIDIIAGKIDEITAHSPTPNSWAADYNNAVGIYTFKMEANAIFTFSKTIPEANRTLFFYKGKSINIDGQQIKVNQLVEFKPDEDLIIENNNEISCFLILEGKPINEPVVQYGPFVMNTELEIREAMKDFGKTQFGGWPWKEAEQVHPRNKGRFALHANGLEENL